MSAASSVLDARVVRPATDALALDVLEGLSRSPKSIPSMHLYDARGSELFRRITELEEYYPTRCEREILETCAEQIAATVSDEPFRLVELGAGDGQKTEVLLRQFLRDDLRFEYAPADICPDAISGLAESLRQRLPALRRVDGLVADYDDALALLRRRKVRRNFVLLLGSNIGNFDDGEARRLLHNIRRALCPGDHVMIGFDLKKDIGTLVRAYNDARGVTREFNLNLLDRINRELGGEFDRRRFMHYSPYNVREGRIESWLVSLERQEVRIAALDRAFCFQAWEGIFIECSYKYDVAQVEELAAASGFVVRRHFFDRRRWFLDSLWQAAAL